MQKKDIIQLGITGVLVIVLLFVGLHTLNGKKTKAAPPLDKKGLSQQTTAVSEKGREKGLFVKLEQETKGMELKRDPFLKKQTSIPLGPSHGLSLSGIIWDQEKYAAVINNRIVSIGDKIEGNVVLDIKKDSVILTDGNINFELTIGK